MEVGAKISVVVEYRFTSLRYKKNLRITKIGKLPFLAREFDRYEGTQTEKRRNTLWKGVRGLSMRVPRSRVGLGLNPSETMDGCKASLSE